MFREFVRIFSMHKSFFKDVVILMHTRQRLKLYHPIITPHLFHENPKCFYYQWPEPIKLEKNRPFKDKEFDKSLSFRGTVSLMIHLMVRLGYKKVVLLGVDLHTHNHFYDNIEELKIYNQQLYKQYEEYGLLGHFESMHTNDKFKGNKYRKFDDYLFDLRNYLYRKNKTELFIGLKDKILYPKLPSYFD